MPVRFFGQRGIVVQHEKGHVTVDMFTGECDKAREIPETSVVLDSGHNTPPVPLKGLNALSNQQKTSLTVP